MSPGRWFARNWKGLLGIFVGIVIAGVVVNTWYARASDAVLYRRLTGDQRRIVKTLGDPSRFTVAYLPLGEPGERQLVRTEIWYYPEHSQSVSFVRGRIVNVSEMQGDPVSAVYSGLKPWDFDVDMDAEAVAAATGGAAVRADVVPGLTAREGVDAYVSEMVVYALESGRLVYVQSLGQGGTSP